MVTLRDIPLFKALPKVELAKLIPDVETVYLQQGAVLSPFSQGRAVYFIHSGWVEILTSDGKMDLPLFPLGPGEGFGDLASVREETPEPLLVRAGTEVRLFRLTRERFEALCSANPALAQGVSQLLARRMSQIHSELGRTKRMLTAYAEELWNDTPDDMGTAALPEPVRMADHEAAAAVLVETGRSTGAQLHSPGRPGFRPGPGHLVAVGKILLVLAIFPILLLPIGLDLSSQVMMLLLLVWAGANWFVATLPDYAVGLALITAAAAISLVKPAVAFSGFSNPIWFLSLGVYGIGAAIQRSGLLYRFALFMLRSLPPVYWGQSLAMALTGLILTPSLPSANGRVMIASPLARELSEAMRIPNRTDGSMGLALACHHGFGQMFFLFMNGTGSCLMVWGLLPPAVREKVTWWYWLFAALPAGSLIFAGFYLVLLRLGRNYGNRGVDRKVLDLQVAALGPLSRHERLTLVVTVGVLLGFMTQPVHRVDPAWLAVSGLLVLLGLGVVDKSSFRSNIDWTYLTFFGALISLAEVIRHTGLQAQLANLVTTVLAPLSGSPWIFLGSLVLLTYIVRVIIPWPSTVLLVMVATMPVAIASGYSPFLTGLVMLIASNPWFLPHQNTVYLNVFTGTSEEAFTHRQAIPYGILYALITLAAVLLSTPHWKWLGLLP